jgi:chitin synthase
MFTNLSLWLTNCSGPAPEGRMLRRHKTKKRVPLTAGNLVIDLPIPDRLVLPKRGTEEMMTTRYMF